MLVDLNISTYSGRRKDSATQDEVTRAKGAGSRKASSVYKSLFAGSVELEAITKFQAKVRQDHYRLTLPWSDNGQRLLPTQALGEYQNRMNEHETVFHDLVKVFLDKYDTLVAAAAFQLGTLFDRREYLTRERVESSFSMSTSFTPLPIAGDFRLDVESEVQDELIAQYEDRMKSMLERAHSDAWQRLYSVLKHMSDRLSVDGEGKKNKFHDTLVGNAEELCGLLKAFNVMNDPKLETARAQLENAMVGVSPEALRVEDDTRAVMKRTVDAILKSNDWGISDDEQD